MKYILKLTVFALLGLLLVSCSKSNSKHNASIKLQGVLEKGKATDGLCKISTLDGKAYSESNHIKNGGYVASVPAGAFDVVCTINKYIDDITGETKTPTSSIVLEAISFAKAGKNKTVNVNVITDLVAKELIKSKGKIKDEKSFDNAKKDAKNTVLKDILSELGQSTIKDIDTLHLDRTENNILTKVSLAIQEQIDDPNSHITTVSRALRAAKSSNSIANQDVNDLSLDAIATPPTNIQTPKPTGQTQKITLTGATIGEEDVATSPTNIDASNPVPFSIPTKNLGEIAASDSVYITSDKLGQTTLIKLDGGKSAPYSTRDVKDLFKLDGETTFTICVIPTIKTLDSTANGKCLSAKIKKTFVATAASSIETKNPDTTGTGIDGAKTPAGETHTGTVSVTHTGTINKWIDISKIGIGKSITDTSNTYSDAGMFGSISLVIPKTIYSTTDDIYIKGDNIVKLDKTTSLISLMALFNNETKAKLSITPKTITFCKVAKGAAQPTNCKDPDIEEIYLFMNITNDISLSTDSAVITSSVHKLMFATINNLLVKDSPIGIDLTGKVSFIVNGVEITKTDEEEVYITSDATITGLTILNPIQYGNLHVMHLGANIKDLFKTNKTQTTFTVCILPKTSKATVELCKASHLQQIFHATGTNTAAVVATNAVIASLTADVKIDGKSVAPVTRNPVSINGNKAVHFSMPAGLVTGMADTEWLYITSDKAGAEILDLKKDTNANQYTSPVFSLLSNQVTTVTICVLPKLTTAAEYKKTSTCLHSAAKQTFIAIIKQ